MESKITQETLVNLVSRLETIVNKLEGNGNSNQTINTMNLSSALLSTEKIAAFTEFWNKTLLLIVQLKKQAIETKKPEIEDISDTIAEAICFQQDILMAAETYKKPQNKDLQDIAKKYFIIGGKLDSLKKEKPEFGLHCEAAKNGFEAVCWIFNDNSCDSIAQTYSESIEYPANKLFMQKIPEVTAWIKTVKLIFKEVTELVKVNFKNGINWSLKGEDDINKIILTLGTTYRKNFKKSTEPEQAQKNIVKQEESRKQIKDLLTSGELRKSLRPIENSPLPKEEPKKVETKSEEQKKEEPKKEEPIKQEAQSTTSNLATIKRKECKKGRRETIYKKGKNEKYEPVRGSHYFQNLEDEIKELNEEQLETKTILTLNNCYGCTFSVKKKINAIKLSNCENCTIICDSLISILEIINCVGLRIQVDGIVRSFTIDGSNEITFLVYNKCKEAQYIVSKSNEVRIRVRKDEDHLDFDEILVPEQFVFNVNDKKKLDCKVSDLYNY